MIPYYALIFLPIFIYALRIKDQTLEKKNKTTIGLFFLLFMLMLMLRHVSIGRDLIVYSRYFEIYSKMSWDKVIQTEMEPAYILLNRLVYVFTDNFQWMVVVTGAITVIPMWYTYSKSIEDTPLAISMFLIMPTFVMVFSGLRQTIAIAIGMIAYEFTKRHKIIPFILSIVLAFFFHRSAFILIFMYPLYHIRLTRKWLFFVIPSLGVLYIFNKPVFSFLNRIFGDIYEAEVKETGAYAMLVLFIVFAIYSFVVVDDSKLDDETIGIRNLLLISVAIQMFAPLHGLAMRMNYYYILFIPLLIPRIINRCSPQWEKIVFVSRYVMALYFLFRFFDHAPSGNILDTFPYKFFWEA